ncbi:thiolase family protein [Alcaligenes sp. AB3]|uniref:thiolase family protein n=1 Tax=Alcaligenes sp. AB3 TaxID=2962569 RepID=UPI002881EC8C|nr:thiolase family protein [Alcaligenes sp. AB3]MDT0217415.1 thiolase family protein [Alcaligenes sp. AB3]
MSADAAILGIAECAPVRYSVNETTLSLLANVSIAALHDAKLEREDIDALFVGVQVGETPQHVPATVAEYLGIQPKVGSVVDLGGASAIGMAWRAAAAIQAGMCTTALCVLGNTREASPPRSPNRNPIREFDVPFGASGANISYAFLAARHSYEYGTTSEQLAKALVMQRDNARAHPYAYFRDQPLTVEDVLTAPMVATPFRLYDIVMPCSGAAAFIVTSVQQARRRSAPVIRIAGAGEKVTHRAMSQAPSLTSGPLKPAIAQALQQAGVGIEHMDTLSLYDCYSIMLPITLEDAGVCGVGQGGFWLAEHNTRWEGDMPINTHGGQLSFGQPDLAGGMSHIIETVRQLRHEAEGRQVAEAQWALVTGNGATLSEACAMVLQRES